MKRSYKQASRAGPIRLLIVQLFLAAFIAFTCAGPTSAQTRIMIALPSWPGGEIMANLIGQVIESRYGHKVGYVPRANAGIFAAMDLGHGEIDIHPDVWLPNQQYFVDVYVRDKQTVLLSDTPYEGRSGICVPTQIAQDHAIRTVRDLADPSVQAALDLDGDGRGEIWVGQTDWVSTYSNLVRLRDYGLVDSLAPSTEAEAVFFARLSDAIGHGRGAAFYCYIPHYIHIQHDLTMLEEPPYDPSQHTFVAPDQDVDWYAKSRILTGAPDQRVAVAFSSALRLRHPEIAKLVADVRIHADDLSKMLFDVHVDRMPLKTVVANWVQANANSISAWGAQDR